MKIYNSEKTKKASGDRKVFYWAVMIAAVIALSLTATLVAVFGSGHDDESVAAGGNNSVTDTVVDAEKPNGGEDEKPNVDPIPGGSDPIIEPSGGEVVTYVAPTSSGRVIRGYSAEQVVYMPSVNMWKTHEGVDFAAAEGEQVLAVSAGTILSVEETTLEGVVVTVRHNGELKSVYKSLLSASVKAGDSIEAGDVIGVAGNMMTESSDGVHVHLEMYDGETSVDPLEYIDIGAEK